MKHAALLAPLAFVATLTSAGLAHAQSGRAVVVAPAQPGRPAAPPTVVVPAQPPGGAVVVQPGRRAPGVAIPPQGGAVVVNPYAGAPATPPTVMVQPTPMQQVQPGYVGPQGRAVVVPPGSPPLPALPAAPVIVSPPGRGGMALPPPSRVMVAPPPMRFDAPSMPAPAPGYVWIPGYNHWSGNGYIWVPGHYEMPPQPGVVWIAPRWVPRGGYNDYYPGYWSTPEYVQQQMPPTYYGQQMLMPGSSMQGMLQYGDRTLPNGSLANDYQINLSPGQTISIAVHGGPSWSTPGGRLDPMVQVLGNGETLLAQDDDSGGGQDSMVIFTPVRGGAYTIRVTSYGGGMNQGYYTLNTRYGVVLGGL